MQAFTLTVLKFGLETMRTCASRGEWSSIFPSITYLGKPQWGEFFIVRQHQ